MPDLTIQITDDELADLLWGAAKEGFQGADAASQKVRALARVAAEAFHSGRLAELRETGEKLLKLGALAPAEADALRAALDAKLAEAEGGGQ